MNNRIKYYLLISSNGIGGAETRALKIISYLSNELSIDCTLILSESLYKSYKTNKFTEFLINNEKIKIKVVDQKRLWFLKDHHFNLLLKDKRLFRWVRFIPDFFLKRISWYNYMLKNIPDEPNVKIHCIHGETPRIGSLYWAREKDQDVNIEITSNRHVEEWAVQFRKCLPKGRFSKNLYANCVSKTVYQNFSRALMFNAVDVNDFSLDFYNGPFLYFPKMYKNAEKENIIVFAHRLISTKSPILFAEVVKELYDEGILSNWKVYFRGDGAQREPISELLRDNIEDSNIEIGYTSDLQNDLRISKVFVSLVTTGNFPSNSVFEAMNYSNILLLSDTGITKEKFDFADVNLCDLNHESLKKALLKVINISENEEAFKKSSTATHSYYNYMVEKGEYMLKLNSVFKLYDEKNQ